MAPSYTLPERNRVKVSNLFCLLGPSGSGKTSAITYLLSRFPDRLSFPLTYTTRAPRNGETPGKDMYFVSDDEWTSSYAKGEYMCSTEYAGARYGTKRTDFLGPLSEGRKILCALDRHGVEDLILAGLGPVVIYFHMTKDKCRQYLAQRWPDSPEKIEARLAQYDHDYRSQVLANYIIPTTNLLIPEIATVLEQLLCLHK